MESRLRITILIWLVLSSSALPAKAAQSPSENPALHKVYFVDELQGWILGSTKSDGLIIQSTDGGQTWHERYRCSEELFNLKFANHKVGWVVGSNGTILRTADGGNSWKRQISGTNVLLTGLAVLDSSEAWVAGASGTLLYTNDGGVTWNERKINSHVGISDITFVDPKHGRAIGYGTILITNDGGKTWELKSSGDWKQLSSVLFVNANIGWITVGPVVLRTVDGGITWSEISPPSQGQATSLSFMDAQHGWLAKSRGEEGSVVHIPGRDKVSSESFILSTSDGGVTWQNIFRLGSGADHSAWVLNMFFVNRTKGWAVGRGGLIMRTLDSGKSWQRTQFTLTASAATCLPCSYGRH